MKLINKLKIINDPIYGFITIPNELTFDLIEHPYFQRLRRISQMGLSYLVYPGAHHTRYHHAMGSMYLMQKSIEILRFKGIEISEEEANALRIAILLHDIGHAPFSHTLEYSLIKNGSHEAISIAIMEVLNKEFSGALTMAIQIYKDEFPRKFLHQLISSQLDMDRLDYLKRDSFYTGVTEGAVNSERLITMLNVVDDNLVVEEKGIYSIEKFIVARRLMYWQVYLHKTCFGAEKLLEKTLARAKELALQGVKIPASKALSYFLNHDFSIDNLDDKILKVYTKLDDYDVLSAIKEWINGEDEILSLMAKRLINRDLLKVEFSNEPFSSEKLNKIKTDIKNTYRMTDDEVSCLFYTGSVFHQAYDTSKNNIRVLYKDGRLKDISKASDQLNIQALSSPVQKYYCCYPKDL